jgi:hypothetical protein
VDEIQVQIEQSSGSPPARRARPRGTNPILLATVTGLGVVALVVWLGSTTPDQAMPVETTTSTTNVDATTTTTAPVAETTAEPEDVLLAAWNQWFNELDTPVGFETLVGQRDLTFVVSSEVETTRLVNISDSGVSVSDLGCGMMRSPRFVSELGDHLILETGSPVCVLPKDGSQAPEVIDGAPILGEFVAVDKTSGWFCTWRRRGAEVFRYSLGEPIGEAIDVPSCPLMATPRDFLMETEPFNLLKPDEGFYWWRPGGDPAGVDIQNTKKCELAQVAAPFLLCPDGTEVRVVNLITDEVVAMVPLNGAIEVDASVSPTGQYLLLSPYPGDDDMNGATASGPIVLELETGKVTNLELLVDPHDEFGWISETQIATFTEAGSGCLSCPSQLMILDVATSARVVLEDLPGEYIQILS